MKKIIKSFLRKLNISSSIEKRLLGQWRIDPADTESIKLYGATKVTFNKDNTLFYDIETEERTQRAILTYKVMGEYLQTDQPSAPKKEMTPYKFQNGKLELYFDGDKSTYIKC